MIRTIFVICLFVLPYGMVFFLAPQWNFQLGEGWFHPFFKGVEQASISALCSLVLGVFLSLSLFASHTKRRLRWVMASLLAPQIIPPLFVILSLMSLAQFFDLSHQGLFWVVVAHTLLNAGLFAVTFYVYVRDRLSSYLEVARALGATGIQRHYRVTLPLLVPLLIPNFLLIFILCLLSFSIPFVLSGGVVTSLEVHLFRLVRSEGLWGMAVLYSFIQSFVVFGCATIFWLMSPKWKINEIPKDQYFNVSSSWAFLALMPLVSLLFFWVFDSLSVLFDSSMRNFLLEILWSQSTLVAFLNTLILALLVFSLQLLLSVLVTYGSYSKVLDQFFHGYMAPSIAVLGFSFVLLPDFEEAGAFLKTALCFSLVTFPVLFRWQLLEKWKGLRNQTEVARVLGASQSECFWRVIWPQVKENVFYLSLMAGVWSLGDFAVSSFFLSPNETLSLIVVDLLNKYRVEVAGFISLILFTFGVSLFYIGRGVSRSVPH